MLTPRGPAIDARGVEVIQKCINFYGEKFIDIDKLDTKALPGAPALIIATLFDYRDTVAELIKYNAKLDIQTTGKGMTALIYAAALKKVEIANMLLDANADVKIRDYSLGDALI